MATFYLDFEGGNDANDGTTFANRWKTLTSGATAARIAPGDTIRMMSSPAPTSLGITAEWTHGPFPPVLTVVSSTDATPISLEVTGHGFATGDTVCVDGHAINTRANGVWEITVTDADNFTLDGSTGTGGGAGTSGTVGNITNHVVRLASPVTANIACQGNRGQTTNWTAAASVTCSVLATNRKEGAECQQIAIAAGHMTGKAAYLTLSATDFSGYEQVSFWVRTGSGNVSAGGLSLCLCSDTTGDTPVDTLAFPEMIQGTHWQRVTINKGSALGSAIQSVALYVNTDTGARTVVLDDIIAVKAASSADSLSLCSLIGKNSAGEYWWPVQSINGTRVVLDGTNVCEPRGAAFFGRGYYGASETVTTYKREPVYISGVTADAIQDSGTDGSPIVFDGGWNRTDMSTKDDITCLAARHALSNSLVISGGDKSFVTINDVLLLGGGGGLSTSGTGLITSNSNFNLNNVVFVGAGGFGCVLPATSACVDVASISGVYVVFGRSVSGLLSSGRGHAGGLTVVSCLSGGVVAGSCHLSDVYVANCSGQNILADTQVVGLEVRDFAGSGVTTSGVVALSAAEIHNSTGPAFDNSGLLRVIDGATSGNASVCALTAGEASFRNLSVGEATVFTISTGVTGRAAFENFDGVSGDHRIYHEHGYIFAQTSVRHTASGIAWAMQPTSTGSNAAFPLRLPIAKVACVANEEVTASVWLRRDDTGLTMKLVCPAYQLDGIGVADVETSMTAAVDTWEEVTVQFTPTEAGVVELFVDAYGGTTYTGYVDDFSVAQA